MQQTLEDNQELKKRLMAMGQMAASLAHEIRNPLGSMELFCTLLKKDLQEQPHALDLAEQIHSSIRRVDYLISNCLQFSRDIQPKRAPLEDIPTFLEDIVKLTEAKAVEIGVSVELEHQGDGEVYADSYLISQAVSNLIGNALDAVSAIENPSIRFKSQIDEYWCLSVSDNGVGISDEDRQHVFDPFYSTKKGGTGLGLAIVHSIIAAHGGAISILSRPGKGTEVTLRIPRYAR